jgi:hypothetical protein
MKICNYITCIEKAVAEGFVMARNPDGGKDIPTTVYACEEHKHKNGFFLSKDLSVSLPK